MISIIIPVYNEEVIIEKLIAHLFRHANGKVGEVLLIDGGSTDNTKLISEKAGAKVLVSPQKGRAAQMHFGATMASGEIFYFVHADTIPPATYAGDIIAAVAGGYNIGRYKTRFDSAKWLLRLNAFFTRFDFFLCMGGDQTLFITRELYERSGGFDITMRIMEEFEFCKRARQQGKYKILNGEALVSARKYDENTWWQVQKANYTVVKMYRGGASQEALVQKYKEMLNYR